MQTLVPARRYSTLLCPCLFLLLLSTLPAFAQNSGSVYTSTSNGAMVNANLFDLKIGVYLNGGPQNQNGSGLPDGVYYFEVTDPSGAILLSADDISCRQIQVSNGRVSGVPSGGPPASCTTGFHSLGSFNPANMTIPVQVCPATLGPRSDNLNGGADFDASNWCDTTPNGGGEYKVWATPAGSYNHCSISNTSKAFGFCDSDSKTDNFKVKKPQVAYVKVCKFNDLDGDGSQQDTEPFIPGWPIVAIGVDSLSGPIATADNPVHGQTGPDGCVSFSVSDFTTAGGQVTITENFLTGWQETAPNMGAYAVSDGKSPADGSTVTVVVSSNTGTGNSQALTVTPDDSVTLPNFGNTCLVSSCGGNTIELTVTKDANPSLTRTYGWTIDKSVDHQTVYSAGGAASDPVNYTVTLTPDSGKDSGWQVNGTIKISNPSLIDIGGVTVTDNVDNGGTCTITDSTAGANETIPAGTTVNVPYVCTYTSKPADGLNTATATWNSGASTQHGAGNTLGTAVNPQDTTSPGSSTGQASVSFANPAVKVVDGSVTVKDALDNGTPVPLGTPSYSDPSPITFTYSHTFADKAGACTSHTNVASFVTNDSGATGNADATVQDCQGADLTVTKTATPAFDSNISKSVDKAEIDTYSGGIATFNYTVTVTESNWTVSGNVTVANPNDWESVTANITDTLSDSGGSCSFTGGNSVVVGPGSSVSAPYTCTFSSAPATSGLNSAGITWDQSASHTPGASASGTASYTFGSLTVTDTIGGTLGTISAPAASTTFTYANAVTAPTAICTTIPNTASITGGASASQSAKVCGASDLIVSKTAAGSFNSNIVKTGPATVQNTGSSTLDYTVTVTESGWAVAGSITVANPNNWESITLSGIVDSLSDLAGCTVTPPSLVVPASSFITAPYGCVFSGVPNQAAGVNTAMASWTGGYTIDHAASGSAPYGFAALTVTDAFNNPTTPKTLGTISVPIAITTYKDSYNVPASDPGVCVAYPNTATVSPTGQSSSWSVNVCNPKTGALTMGFWQNPNGQAIIKTNCGGTSGTSLMSFLAGFNPFKDDTVTKCTDETTYVTNIIKAASCTSSTNTCNSMLRAQMLATALDVYFSDPALGGQKIGSFSGLGAHQPVIGGIAIDLSTIHPCADSGGTSSCASQNEDVRPEFGIAPPCLGITVGQMLSYANFASITQNGNPVASMSAGASWYRQSKSRQVFAKDGFDNTNNQIANIAPTSCSSAF